MPGQDLVIRDRAWVPGEAPPGPAGPACQVRVADRKLAGPDGAKGACHLSLAMK